MKVCYIYFDGKNGSYLVFCKNANNGFKLINQIKQNLSPDDYIEIEFDTEDYDVREFGKQFAPGEVEDKLILVNDFLIDQISPEVFKVLAQNMLKNTNTTVILVPNSFEEVSNDEKINTLIRRSNTFSI